MMRLSFKMDIRSDMYKMCTFNRVLLESTLEFVVLTAYTCVSIHPASPMENHGDVSWVVSTPRSPVPVSLHLLARPVGFEGAGASVLHTPTLLVG